MTPGVTIAEKTPALGSAGAVKHFRVCMLFGSPNKHLKAESKRCGL